MYVALTEVNGNTKICVAVALVLHIKFATVVITAHETGGILLSPRMSKTQPDL